MKLDIITLFENVIGVEDGKIEVEYQSDTIGKYGIEFVGKNFLLTQKQTASLVSDKCEIPEDKLKVKLSDLQNSVQSCCTPDTKCR